MIAWQNPAAFAGLAALAVPIVLHLLRRRQAVRVLFPSVRFIRRSLTGSIRVRPPSDWPLLAIRLAILAFAVCATAQPVILTSGRLETWNARTVRAVVVDTSESMRRHRADVERALAAESNGPADTIRIESADLDDGIRRAVGVLLTAAPGRREVVVISDATAGAIDGLAIETIPKQIGLRFIRVGEATPDSRFAGGALAGAAGGVDYQSITLTGPRTRVLVAPSAERMRGLDLVTADPAEAVSLMNVVASSGAPAPAPDQPIVMFFRDAGGERFTGRHSRAKTSPLASGWMLDTALGMRHEPELARAARNTAPAVRTESAPPWVAVARAADGAELVRVAALDRALAVDVAAPAESYLAAAAVRAVLWARTGDAARQFAEREVLRIPDERLKRWSRQPGPVSRDAWPHSTDNDARWFWAAVLALIAVETIARRRTRGSALPEARAA